MHIRTYIHISVYSGAMKQSAIERALVKVGSYDNNAITLDQFIKLTDIIQKEVDATKLSESYERKEKATSTSTTTSTGGSSGNKGDKDQSFNMPTKGAQVLKLSTTSDEDDISGSGQNYDPSSSDESSEEDYEDDISEDEATREIYNTLLPKGATTLPLIEFIRWQDVQELLETGALTKDDLASAIEKTGTTVENGDLTFETVRIMTLILLFFLLLICAYLY